MKNTKKRQERGQALIMVTLSIVLICGMLGLVVDLGWGFFVKRSAQSAADAAALAAARKAYSIIGQQGNYNCGINLDCQNDDYSLYEHYQWQQFVQWLSVCPAEL